MDPIVPASAGNVHGGVCVVSADLESHPYPAELAVVLGMPKPTVTRLALNARGRKATSRGLALLSDGFGTRLERLSAAERTTLQRLLEKLA